MNILITNDDGWGAKGILTLTRLMRQIGEVTVIAPDGPRSGQSSAISVNTPVRLKQIESDIYICNGTPVDCIKLSVNTVFKERKPDLIVSGINHGSNAAVNVLYSGTMGAVFTAAENGIPAIGFSLCDHSPDADFSYFEPYVLELTQKLMERKDPHGTCYNINAPIGPLKGIRITRQCKGLWQKEFQPYTDPQGNTFYLLTGSFHNNEPEAEDTDEWALANGYIALTPTTIDMTDYTWRDLTNIGLA